MDISQQSVVLANGLRLTYAETGSPNGVPVLLVPGYGDSWRFWIPLFGRLPESVRLIALSPRGHGDSDKPETGYSLEDFSHDLGEFMDALNITQAIVAGHSSGGYVTRRFAIDQPGRVRALMLIGSPLSLHGRRAPFAETVEAFRDPIDPSDIRAFMESFTLFGGTARAFAETAAADALKIPARVWHQTLAGLIEAVPPPPESVHAPTLVIWGADDDFLSTPEQEALTRAIPAARRTKYPQAGHLVLWDAPDRVAQDLMTLIKDSPKGP